MSELSKMVRGLLDMIMIDDDEYKTVIIGVLVGTKEEVIATEKAFDKVTDELLASHAFMHLSGFTFKKEAEEQ